MSKIWVCGDPGSCHLGSLDKARELVTLGAACGLDAVKFQLLTAKESVNGNIPMDWEWMPELIAFGSEKGILVYASVFDFSGLSYLASIGCKAIKFSFSQSHLLLAYAKSIPENMRVYASYDTMSADIFQNAIRYYVIPEYPVRYVVDFEGVFPRFDGFSSHCLGMQQEIRAAEAGAKYLEFHFQGDWDSPCPDGRFAKRPKLMDEMIKRIKR